MRNSPAGYKHSDPAHLQFGQSADSALLRKRFAVGGLVQQGEDLDAPAPIEEDLLRERMADIDRMGKGSPKEYELEKNRSESVIQDAEPNIDPNWKAHTSEDI